MTDLPPAIPAATLVVFRDRIDAPADLLMVERARAMAFAGGALVFPGGRVDPGDHALASVIGDGSDETAARIAAIRETIEETGLAIGVSPIPDAETIARLRATLHAGAPFGEALAATELSLMLDDLIPFARWRPAHRHARIFDTRFYLAAVPPNAPPPTVDATENTRLLWASATDVLEAADRGEAQIIFPTRRNLERLAQFGSFEDAAAHAHATPIRTITPFEETRDGMPHLCIPDDAGYPVTSQRLDEAMRG